VSTPAEDAPAALLIIAQEAARAGGAVAAAAFGRAHAFRFKADASEVTEFDEAAEAAVRSCIEQRRPGDLFIGEESTHAALARGDSPLHGGAVPPSDRVVWVVDPIDGTRNFIRRIPFIACSVGVLRGGEPIAGAIYDPLRDLMYSASLGGGAWLNGERLEPPAAAADSPSGRKWIIAVPTLRLPSALRTLGEVVDRHWARNLGSSALHLAYVAAAAFDASITTKSKLWDLAAGAALLGEVGAPLTTPEGKPVFPPGPEDYRGRNIPTLSGYPEAWAELRAAVKGK